VSTQQLKVKGTKEVHFGGSGKRRRDQGRDILANIRDGFAKRRARLGGQMDTAAVVSFGSALGLDMSGGNSSSSSSSSQ
tara:strand:- start:52 stop:288 length:237 start_codon:yes stop_codon:yes gene_type:complete